MSDRPGEPAPQAEAALRATAGAAGRSRYTLLEYEAVLANASIGIAFTRERRFSLCNARFAAMLGYAPEELVGQPGEIVYPSAESYAALGRIAVPILSSGQQLDTEWEMRRKDGSTFLARVIAKAINPRETGQGTIWISEDITARKRDADEAARLAREQEAILGAAPVGICFVRERVFVRCNPRLEEMHGYAPGEMAGLPTAACYHDEAEYRAVGEGYRQLAQGRAYTGAYHARRKDGSTFWSRVTGRAMDPSDPAKGSVWLVEDVTEQRRAESDLARVLAEQQALLHNALVGIAFVRERAVQRANRRFEELFGYGAGEANGLPVRQMLFTDEEETRWARAEEELARGRVQGREQWLRRRDGSGFWCRLSARALDPEDAAKGLVWVFDDVSERRRADEAVQRLLREQNALLEGVAIGIAFLRDGRVARCNARFEEIFGFGRGELLGHPVLPLYAFPEDFDAGRPAPEHAAPEEPPRQVCRMLRRDGSAIWVQVSRRPLQPGDAEQGDVWLYDDVTLAREAEERARQAYREQELTFEFATVGIAYLRDRVIQRCNPSMAAMFGYAPAEMAGLGVAELYPDVASFQRAGEESSRGLAEGDPFTAEREFRRRDGTRFWCKVVGRAIDPARVAGGTIWIFDDISAEREARESLLAARAQLQDSHARLEASHGELERAVAARTAELKAANERLQREIDERQQAEHRAQHLADHDALTGLPNRRLLEDRLTQALALSARNRKLTAVMFVDLDRFKEVNDALGHAAGDELLKEAASRLGRHLRVGDTICRIGGDEFVIVLPEISRASDAAAIARKLIEGISAPARIAGREVTLTPSIGISVSPDDGRDAETLIRNADAAMYHAKESGRANCQFFTEQMNLAAGRRLALEADLRRALAEGQLEVHYQPVNALADGALAGYEALVRWQHPVRGRVAPREFIPLAEDTGLILPVGDWVLEQACRWAASIGAAGAPKLAVNLSARQFAQPRLVEGIARVLGETGLPARRLELELTEATVMRDLEFTQAALGKLKALGVGVAIDDFGTGRSSLAILKRLAVDTLKIDPSFVAGLPTNPDDCAIVTAILGLARGLGIAVVAEGVERAAQLEFLRTHGCAYAQGHLVGHPAAPAVPAAGASS